MSIAYQGPNFELHYANALALPIDDNSVDLVVTSPPYFGLRSYTDGGEHYEGQIGSEATPSQFLNALIAATSEMIRVLKPSGSIWVNLGDKYSRTGGGGVGSSDGALGRHPRPSSQATEVRPKSLIGMPWRYAIRCIDELGLILRAEVIWSKPNGMPESVTDRVRRSHEQWFHFTKEPHYYSAIDELREPHMHGGKGHTWEDRKAAGKPRYCPDAGNASGGIAAHLLGKLPGSVWAVATEPLIVPDELGVDHFAAFPTEWPKRIISGWCPANGVVLDPFCGTGTTVAVARALGRHGIGVDLSADYLRLAEWRVIGDGYRRIVAKVTSRKPTPSPNSDTPSLFDDTAA